MLDLLPRARTFAYAPVSGFAVGAVARGASGNLYLGANIEFPGQALGLSVHAEQAAIANAYMAGESAVNAIAVTVAPCGHCRQFLIEASPSGEMEVLVEGAAPSKLAALLPAFFGPKDLGREQGMFPVQAHDLTLAEPSQDLVMAALEAARRSYAPYTGSYSGVALAAPDGRILAGSYIENAAFNPSLPPLQTALAGVFASGLDPAAISSVVLVETKGTTVSHEVTTRATLSSLGVQVTPEVIRVSAGL